MSKLKVFGGLTMKRGSRFQERTVVATTTQKKAADLLNMSLHEFRNYWCETGNEAEVEAAMAKPGEVVFMGARV